MLQFLVDEETVVLLALCRTAVHIKDRRLRKAFQLFAVCPKRAFVGLGALPSKILLRFRSELKNLFRPSYTPRDEEILSGDKLVEIDHYEEFLQVNGAMSDIV